MWRVVETNEYTNEWRTLSEHETEEECKIACVKLLKDGRLVYIEEVKGE